jgi:predicted dinucleotide-binding enzyme
MQIAIIGAGNIGGALARHWHAAGHELVLGVRDGGDPRATALATDVGATIASPAQAANAAAVIALAIPGDAVVASVEELGGGALAGKTIVVPANDMGAVSGNLARAVADAAPGAHVIRAFNTIAAETLAAGAIGGHPVDMFYVSDEPATATAQELIRACGLRPVRVGGIEQGGLIDALFSTWVALAFGAGFGRGIAFSLQEPDGGASAPHPNDRLSHPRPSADTTRSLDAWPSERARPLGTAHGCVGRMPRSRYGRHR